MVAKKAITQAVVQAAKPREKRYEIRCGKLSGFVLRVQPNGRRSYLVNPERGKWKAVGDADVLTLEQARTKAKVLLGQSAEGIDWQAQKREGITFEDFVRKHWGPWYTETHPRSRANADRVLATFTELRKRPLNEITPFLAEKWRRRRLKEVKPASVNRSINDLKAILARAVEWKFLDDHPLRNVKRQKGADEARVRYLTPEEETSLREALAARERRIRQKRASGNEWRRQRGYDVLPDIGAQGFADYLAPMVLVSINTGLRWGELVNLTWDDIDLGLQVVTVRASTAKSGKTRHVPLNAEAIDALRRWGSDREGLVFPGREGAARTHAKRSWAGVLDAADISDFRWHDLRHCFASKLVMAGADLNTVRELLGHSDFKLTLRYAHLAPEHKAAAVALLVGG